MASAVAALRRARKTEILATARRVLREPPLVAVATVTRSDVISLTQARIELGNQDFQFKKFPNRLCANALDGSERAFMRGLFRGLTFVIYPDLPENWAEAGIDTAKLAKRLLVALAKQKHIILVGGALDQVPLYAEDFELLSKMPSQYLLRAELARTLRVPLIATASGIRMPLLKAARTLAAPTHTLARALLARKAQLEETPDVT